MVGAIAIPALGFATKWMLRAVESRIEEMHADLKGLVSKMSEQQATVRVHGARLDRIEHDLDVVPFRRRAEDTQT